MKYTRELNMVENTFSITIIIANIHAPCAHNLVKVKFFEKLNKFQTLKPRYFKCILAKSVNDRMNIKYIISLLC